MREPKLREPQLREPKRRWTAGRSGGSLVWVAPALLFMLAFAIYPVGYSLYISLFDYHLIDPTRDQVFVGLANYVRAFGDQVFLVAVRNTLLFVAMAIGAQMLLGLGIAVLLNREIRGIGLIRSLLLVPLTLTPLVVALVWGALYNADFGPVSYYLKLLGLDIGRGPVGEPSTALVSLVVIDIWQWTPLVALMLLAGLQAQNQELFEAARLDGANGLQQFLHIALPLLRPILVVALLIRTMDVFKLFDSVYAITGGGPGFATEVMNFYIFKTGLTFFDMGYAASMSTLLLVLISFFTAIYIRVIGRTETYA